MSAGTALLLVDLQRDFLADPRLEPEAERLTEDIAALLGRFRELGWPVIHIHTRVAADLSDAMPHWRKAGGGYCLAGTPGAEPPAALAPAPGEPVFTKRFYSGFEDPALLAHLREQGIAKVVIAGVHTHACIRATALAAYSSGFEVVIPEQAIGSYDPPHAAMAREWMQGRMAEFVPLASLLDRGRQSAGAQRSWKERDPTDWSATIDEYPLADRDDVAAAAERVSARQQEWARVPLGERRARLEAWRDELEGVREQWIEALVREIAKPRRDAEGEIGYALALLDHVCRTLADEERGEGVDVRYRPLGTVGIITPWNNPFAMPVSKLAPALGYGNCVLWKPALPGSGVARMLAASLESAGLGEWVECLTGDAISGQALVEAPAIAAVSFTGSVEVGQRIVRRSGELLRPVQAELGGNNAAIVLANAELEAAAIDLAGAMFSFAGQRCTAIRRVIVEEAVYAAFAEALKAQVSALRVGMPGDTETQLGPVISKPHQQALLSLVEEAASAGATVLTGGGVPKDMPREGCWVAPTVISDLPERSPILTRELFGPVVALVKAKGLDQALAEHNRGEHGLLGALYSQDTATQARFLSEAEAGLLLLNQARPAFSAAGPFTGWKASGYGTPEHGRWNRDFWTKVQAVYGRPSGSG